MELNARTIDALLTRLYKKQQRQRETLDLTNAEIMQYERMLNNLRIEHDRSREEAELAATRADKKTDTTKK